jgi:hypothetical protein
MHTLQNTSSELNQSIKTGDQIFALKDAIVRFLPLFFFIQGTYLAVGTKRLELGRYICAHSYVWYRFYITK